ncbi:MAG: hypothetical protein RJA57_1410, partial [Bacteroidota bacterium]
FASEAEGFVQTVLRQEGEKVYIQVRIRPHAPGPPEHLHAGFDEVLTVIEGTLSVNWEDGVRNYGPGETVQIPRGTYHRLFNASDAEVVVGSGTGAEYLPLEFAYSLVQIYPLMDPKGGMSLRSFCKYCVLDELFDSVIKGPPPQVVGFIRKVVKPWARLFGMTPYDERSRPA